MFLKICIDKLVTVAEIYTALNTQMLKVKACGFIRDINIYKGQYPVLDIKWLY